jgi:hypothetical protein
MRSNLVIALLATTALALATSPLRAAAETDPSAPESAILSTVKALRGDDFKALFASLPPEDQAKAKEQWTKTQGETDAKNSAEFDQLMGKLLAPDAVEQLTAQAEPQLKQMDPAQISQGLMMASGFLPMMLQNGPDGKPRQMTPDLQHTITMIQGILTDASQWVTTAGLNDPKKLQTACEHLVAGAKALGVKDTKELHALAFDELLARLGPLVKEAKAALGAYEIDANKFLDSISAKSVGDGDQRTLNVAFTLFGHPYEAPIKVEKVAGKWVLAKDAAPAGFDAFGSMLKQQGGTGGDEGVEIK